MVACCCVQARTMDVGEIPPPITPEHNPPFVPVRGRICLIAPVMKLLVVNWRSQVQN